MEILAEILDQILHLIRQDLIGDLREEDVEELEDVLVVERGSLIKENSVHILQEAVTERNSWNARLGQSIFTFPPVERWQC